MKVLKILLCVILTISCLSSNVFARKDAIPLLSELTSSSSIYNVELSPDAKYWGAIRVDEQRSFISITEVETGNEIELISFSNNDNTELTEFSWADHKTIIFEYTLRHSSNKNPRRSLLHIGFDEAGQAQVRRSFVRRFGYVVSALPGQEDRVLFAEYKSIDNKPTRQLRLVNYEYLRRGKEGKVLASNYPQSLLGNYHFSADEDGKRLMAVTSDEDLVKLWSWREGDKDWRKVLELSREDWGFVPVGLLDNDRLAVLSSENSDKVALYEFDIAEKKYGKLLFAHDKYDILNAGLGASEGRVDWVRYADHGVPVVQYLNSSSKKIQNLFKKKFPDLDSFFVSSSLDGNWGIVYLYSSASAGMYYLFDLENLQIRLLAHRIEPLKSYEFSMSESYQLKSEDGLLVESSFLPAMGDGNGVLLVNPHGGPVGVRDYDLFDYQAQFFSTRGYSVLKVNFRGSVGFGKDFMDAGRGELGKAIEGDIKQSVEYIRSKYQFDKVCAIGSSYGAYSSAMLAIANPEVYDCVISRFGVFDLPLLFNERNIDAVSGRVERVEKVVGKMREELWSLSPTYQASKLKAPVLITAGVLDRIAPLEHSNRFRLALREQKSDVSSLYFANSGHGHSSWLPELFELSYIDSFIRSKLDIPEITASNSTSVIAERETLLGRGFSGDVLNDKRAAIALEHFKKAASFDHSEAQFELGEMYLEGRGVDYSLDQARSWLHRAASNGSTEASIRLGDLYFNGHFGETAKAKSFHYYGLAKEQGSVGVNLLLARAECLGIGVVKNVTQCFQKLDAIFDNIDEYKEKDSKVSLKLRKVSGNIAAKARLNAGEIAQFKKLLYKWDHVDQFDASFREKFIGTFSSDKGFMPSREERGTSIDISDSVHFGAYLEVRGKSHWANSDHVAFVVKWQRPELKRPDGSVLPEPYSYYVRKDGNLILATLRLEEPWQRVPGEWILTVESIDGKQLYTRKFKLAKE